MKKYRLDQLSANDLSPKEVLYNIDVIEEYLNNGTPKVRGPISAYWYSAEKSFRIDAYHPHITLQDILVIKNIKTKNDALLYIMNDRDIVRYHCKEILKG